MREQKSDKKIIQNNVFDYNQTAAAIFFLLLLFWRRSGFETTSECDQNDLPSIITKSAMKISSNNCWFVDRILILQDFLFPFN